MFIAGIDIGGTTSGVNLGKMEKSSLKLVTQKKFKTPATPRAAVDKFKNVLKMQFQENQINQVQALGISCGGPLDSKKGLIQSPPNLPGWDNIDITAPFQPEFAEQVNLQNDANAGALAEWYFGAGRGASNLIFLTFGTGMGAGLILNNSLYTGTNDLAGEVGHIRLKDKGPEGYGKSGSFEGFCSGGGIRRLAQTRARKAIEAGNPPSFCKEVESLKEITAKKVGKAAQNGDKLAREIFKISGEKLGYGLSILIDILNPQKIIIGSIYLRQLSLLEPVVLKKIKEEALSNSLAVCEVVPAELGEAIGDYASLAAALEPLKKRGKLEDLPEIENISDNF